jgi:two-component system phosphate regulon response regulator PhoB
VPDSATVLLIACRPLLEVVGRELRRAGMVVSARERAAGALKTVFEDRPALIVISTELPDASGLDVLHAARELADAPVMMIGDEADAATALSAGADAYMAEPLAVDELAARVRVLLRAGLARRPPRGAYRDGLLEVDLDSGRVTAAGTELSLTPLEYRLLRAFVERPNRVLEPDYLLDRLWGDPAAPRARVKVAVGYLRKRFAGAGLALPVETVRGFGYRYVPPA